MSDEHDGKTVRITTPPNTYFHAGEEYHVKDARTNGVLIQRMGVDMVLSPIHFETARKDWKVLHCPSCSTIMFEIDRKTYTPHSVRLKCRSCKEFIVVRGVRPVKFNEKQIEAVVSDLKQKLESGEYQGVEATIALFAMSQAGKLTETQVEAIIKKVYKDNELEAISILARARDIISGDLIDEIVKDSV